ncbi:MAG: CBS domain-containing protein [Flavobacteriales bacterium]|jgi:acetoin utilization protein AcuB|nr:CBS domain-containing protein [Flavobacteriales bacterium]MBK6549977.1 CBS domain-containing protein [Flavobacteriales bacterium]MBK6881859.1 CBS domain-containing protein [Flavobacteriales bacterium]MBK7102487.1 CBS domain-containing protein [Flavobacteriales bacterium]MBK7113222.1 CBS domain-containing protein [Flavobacteriales bacterium]
MHAIDLITSDIPPLRPQDEVGRALDWLEEFKVSHLPVVEGGRLVGLVKEQDLVDRTDPRGTVNSLMEQVEVPFIRGNQHVYEVMKLFTERGLSVLPVLDELGNYLGAITEHEALKRLSEITNIHEPGSIVVLEMNQVDYSLQQIAQIVEGNDGRVLSAYSHVLPGTMRLEVTLKINREDISDILQSFERYEIQVKTTYQGSRFHDDLRGRYEELMRFINL